MTTIESLGDDITLQAGDLVDWGLELIMITSVCVGDSDRMMRRCAAIRLSRSRDTLTLDAGDRVTFLSPFIRGFDLRVSRL